ncbi:AraC family transcriptional regulator [Telluribacter sp.]|jgi:AraC-like DNA-binding protein/quercetin dioxygenase-like cupin family protein|uniref:AraC family transcriptional regulator n=1 Tax=Telluribacter sp. TaxID=1978767 RepID=UPI002E14FBF1|nr:AraC family transcriptional regulator [Telluribacter sp.]
MKPLIQKLPLDRQSSFVARTYTTPEFETPWHQHVEYELVLEATGSGTAFVGDHIGTYREGDVFLLGKNLPHWFRKKDQDTVASAVVLQFRDDSFGDSFWALPEMQPIHSLLQNAKQGIALDTGLREEVGRRLRTIEFLTGFPQLAALLECLHQISTSGHFHYLNHSPIVSYSVEDQNRIRRVFEYSMQHFQQKIRVQDVAALTHQSVSAFCHYFKKSTKKSYIQFLTEIRIAHACKLLITTDRTVTEICYESGFYNWSNFSSHFKSLVGMSPLRYREQGSAPYTRGG